MQELTIYPHVMDCGIDCIEDSEGTLRYGAELDDFARAKHFTDAELAAEYYRAGDGMSETNYDRDVSAEPIRSILHRFATHPHALEASDVRE